MNTTEYLGFEADFFERSIEDANDFVSLEVALEMAKVVECSDKTYSAAELVEKIEAVRTELNDIRDRAEIQRIVSERIPSDYGLAGKVTGFLIDRPAPMSPDERAEKTLAVYARADHIWTEKGEEGIEDLQECAQDALSLDPGFREHLSVAMVAFVRKGSIKDLGALASMLHAALTVRGKELASPAE